MMDTIPFERVSIEEVKATMAVKLAAFSRPVLIRDWTPYRKNRHLQEEQVAPATLAWLGGIAEKVRPAALLRRFPRIANKIADLWGDPVICERYLNGLMIDQRGDRQGFPSEVAVEIATLKNYLITRVAPASFDVWGERIAHRLL